MGHFYLSNCHREGKGHRRAAGQYFWAHGPPLRGLAEHWTRRELIEYLADSQRLVGERARLAALAGEYSGEMASYANLTAEERGVLADWLLRR